MDDTQLILANVLASVMTALCLGVGISNRRFANRESDRKLLNELPRHEPAPLIEVLTREARRYHWRRRIIEPIENICRIAVMLSPLLFWFAKGLTESTSMARIAMAVLPWLLVFVPAFAFGFVGRLLGPSLLHRLATERLLEMAGPFVLAALIDMLGVEDSAIRSVAEETLTLRLPHLKTHDGDHLMVHHMEILYRHLRQRPFRNVPLNIAILKGLEQIGDETTIPVLTDLITSGVQWAPSAVQIAAGECLEYVQNRLDSNAAARSLMRASTAPGDPRNQLLRPVSGPSKGDETLLVRPVEQEVEE
jgi:hypothetical protein